MEFVELGDGGFESQLAASDLQPLDEIGDRVSLPLVSPPLLSGRERIDPAVGKGGVVYNHDNQHQARSL